MTTQPQRGKPRYERAKKRSFSLPELLSDTADMRMRQYGLSQFSHYVQMLIRKDLAKEERLAP